ncbi:MAG: class II fumarate hydratase [Bacteroidota bacterium]|nr:class II fumarate hydratase [Bacteroidota bacterium]MDW8137057.1 class II fumarate hydratase [Bacteroidota bacterium]
METSYRIERDSMGEVRVPASAYWGAQTQRAIENFPISGVRFPRRFLEALALIKEAAAAANRELGLLEAPIAEAIIIAARRVRAGELLDQFPLDIYQTGSGTSTNMNMNEVLANLATEALGGKRGSKLVHPNDHVNMGQSSNDVIPSAMHIAARLALEQDLSPALERLAEALEEKARAFDDVIKSGRTHLMDATPVRLGQEFGAYATQIRNGIRRLREAGVELEELALGGTATGTGINRHPDFPARAIAYIAAETGIPFREARDHFEAQAAKDAFVYVAGALNTLATSLLKIANDIRWMGSGPTSGLAELRLPDLQPGSSIMPGKVNPVVNEALMMVCARVMGNALVITIGNQHGNFELNTMMPVMAHAMLESIGILANAVEVFRSKVIAGLQANRERCKDLLERNPSIATVLNPVIGYDRAAEVAKHAAYSGRSVREVVLEMGLLSPEELDRYLNLRQMTEPGIALPGLGGGA